MNESRRLVNQILSIIIQNRPLSTPHRLPSQPIPIHTVSEVLRSIPRLLFPSTRSIGRQTTSRRRTPLRQRNLADESTKLRSNFLLLGPAAHRDQQQVDLGLDSAIEFFFWVESQFCFAHNEMTCRDMALVFARGNRLIPLWEFLREMAKRDNGADLVTTSTITCLIKVLGEEGLVNEALNLFYRMNKYHCKPDVYAYNTMITALCRVGNFKKARFLLQQMELPGFMCPPDTFTYTILISSYCKHGMQTGCKKAIRRRLWEANHMFRLMRFNGFVPDVVTYNALIDGCCKTYRIERALELFKDMNKRGCSPNRVTYNSFIRYYSAVNEIDKAVEMLRKMKHLRHGTPTSSSFTPIIHALCEGGMVEQARDFLVEMFDGGSVPREFTYKLVRDKLRSLEKPDLLDGNLCQKIESAVENRYQQVVKVKPVMIREKLFLQEEL
uniref:Pentatricopeptide repeat-containing protein n=1 Tax=Kalanchoe fedtschenkoi TaxID=63787 RepID=A0A7N0TBR7_KALFE